MKISKLIILTAVIVSPIVHAETPAEMKVNLKDGSSLKGVVSQLEGERYAIDTTFLGRVVISKEVVESVELAGSSAKAAETSPSAKPETTSTEPGLLERFGINMDNPTVTAIQNTLSSDPATMKEIMALASDPELKSLVTDPDFLRLVTSGDTEAIAADPRTKSLMQNPKVKEVIKNFQSSQGQ